MLLAIIAVLTEKRKDFIRGKNNDSDVKRT